MKFVSEYRDSQLIKALASEIQRKTSRKITLMEVCGGHTMAVHRFGLHELLPGNIRLLSGPGCPVCVSDQKFIDQIIAYSELPEVTIATYGDLIRVPGSFSFLEKQRSKGKDIRIIYSVLQALQMASDYPDKKVVFPGIGFETTAPLTAIAIAEAHRRNIPNFLVHSAHKVMPPVMKALVNEGVHLDGFIAPGHVTAITGTSIYDDLAGIYGLGVVVSGFEPSDLMQAILMLVSQVQNGTPKVENQYQRVVKTEGNRRALEIMDEIFETRDDRWRGLGIIPSSGLKIREKYKMFDAEEQLTVHLPETKEPVGCICGLILRGKKTPTDCKLFARSCTPEDPVGACMVSAEGTCATYFKFRS